MINGSRVTYVPMSMRKDRNIWISVFTFSELKITNRTLFFRFDLMYGITESEKFHILPPVALLHGMLDGQRDEVLRDHAKVNLLVYWVHLPPIWSNPCSIYFPSVLIGFTLTLSFESPDSSVSSAFFILQSLRTSPLRIRNGCSKSSHF